MGDTSPDIKSGCGLLNAVFGQRTFWPRRSTSTGSISTASGVNFAKAPSPPRRQMSVTYEAAFRDNTLKGPTKPMAKASSHPNIPPTQQQERRYNGRKPGEGIAPATEGSTNGGQVNQNHANINQGGKIPKEALGISGELDILINDHQRSKGGGNLVRASSGNVMLYGNLGTLRGGDGGGASSALDCLLKPGREEAPKTPNGNYPISVMGNVVKKKHEGHQKPTSSDHQQQTGSLCRAISTRMDPEQLKIMGNEDYRNGNFAEALALYEAAIAIDPKKASYRSNKSAALTALGRLLEAVFECREAIRIEPTYHRAHHRLANLYLRLGEAENAIYHYKHAGPEADHVDLSKAKALQGHLNRCTEAKKLRDWHTLIKETNAAILAGADSAPHIYALQAEALMKFHRHQEADEALTKGPNFEIDACTKFFGPMGNANLLIVRAQVDMAIGRFDDALAAAQRATRLDPNNKEANSVIKKARAIGAARSNGNQLFKAAKFQDACMAYGEGLELDPYNSVLLCNRAACRSKLGQYEKAAEDCNAALRVRPGYSKARLRRAACCAKMGKWEAAIEDYEMLQKEDSEDEEVLQALEEAKAQLKMKKHEFK